MYLLWPAPESRKLCRGVYTSTAHFTPWGTPDSSGLVGVEFASPVASPAVRLLARNLAAEVVQVANADAEIVGGLLRVEPFVRGGRSGQVLSHQLRRALRDRLDNLGPQLKGDGL